MDLPESSIAIAALIIIALPGFISTGVRRWTRGEYAEDRMLGLSIARGATFAITLTSIYLLLFGDLVLGSIRGGKNADTLIINDARGLALIVLVLYVIVPAAVSLVLNREHIEWNVPAEFAQKPVLKWARVPASKHGYRATPSAWDHATIQNQQAWVKIQRSDGQWVGGWYTEGSFATTYPESRSIYIAQQYAMNNEGEFGEAIPNTGIFLVIGDNDLVIWTKTSNLEEQENHAERQEV